MIFRILLGIIISPCLFAQGVGINVSGLPADSSAILDASSITHGFLPPRMTSMQRDAIVNPADGLIIFNTTSGCPNYHVNGAWVEWCGTGVQPYASLYASGTVFCGGVVTEVVDVVNPATGKTWMDRNLGASQAATSSTDASSYGDLYQWGRRADGHQCRTSPSVSSLSSTDQPVHGSFILSPNAPNDWRSPQNDNLWQGVNGVNNPCPIGYRLPTDSEWEQERLSWSTSNSAGAFASPLRLSLGGARDNFNGSLVAVGSEGRYWASTAGVLDAHRLRLNSSNANLYTYFRARGSSVRCIKN